MPGGCSVLGRLAGRRPPWPRSPTGYDDRDLAGPRVRPRGACIAVHLGQHRLLGPDPAAEPLVLGLLFAPGRSSRPGAAPSPVERPSPAGAGLPEDGGDPLVAAPLGVGQRRPPVPVGQVDVGAGLDQQVDRPDVAGAAVAKDDGLQEGGPAEPVDVVDVDRGVEEAPDDLGVAALGGPDQAGAVVAVPGVDVGPGGQGQLQQLQVVLAGGEEVALCSVWSLALTSAPASTRALATSRWLP